MHAVLAQLEILHAEQPAAPLTVRLGIRAAAVGGAAAIRAPVATVPKRTDPAARDRGSALVPHGGSGGSIRYSRGAWGQP